MHAGEARQLCWEGQPSPAQPSGSAHPPERVGALHDVVPLQLGVPGAAAAQPVSQQLPHRLPLRRIEEPNSAVGCNSARLRRLRALLASL